MEIGLVAFMGICSILVGSPWMVLMKKSQPRIVNGTRTTIDKYPFAISVQDKRRHICGGSLFTLSWVLTAAHCMIFHDGGVRKTYGMMLVGGMTYFQQLDSVFEVGVQTRLVSKWHAHPRFLQYRFDCDVMMMKAAFPFVITETVQIVWLPPFAYERRIRNDIYKIVTGRCTVIGWGSVQGQEGYEELPEIYPDHLRKVDLALYPFDDCQIRWNGTLTEEVICTFEPHKDCCSADSGGPLVCPSKYGVRQFGVVAFGAGCASTYFPGVYTRTDYFFDFFLKHSGFELFADAPKPAPLPPLYTLLVFAIFL